MNSELTPELLDKARERFREESSNYLSKQDGASNYEESMLALYRAQIEEYLVKPGFAQKGDLEVKLFPTSKDREASVEIISLSGKNVTQIFRRAFPEEHPPETIPEVHAEMKTIARSIIANPPVPDRPMNRAERRRSKRGRC